MSQPVSTGGIYNVLIGTGAGTTVVSSAPCDLQRIYWGGSFVGTVKIHDASSATGTTANSAVITVGVPLLKYPESITLNTHCVNGIVVEATGTPAITLVWDK